MTTEIFGVKDLPSYIIIDQLAAWPASIITPNFLVYLSSILNDYGFIFKVTGVTSIIWLVHE